MAIVILKSANHQIEVVFLLNCNEPNSNKGTLDYSFEIGYTRKGTKIDHDTLDYKFHDLTAPLLLDFYPIRQIKLSVEPEFVFLTAAKNHSNDSTKTSLANKKGLDEAPRPKCLNLIID